MTKEELCQIFSYNIKKYRQGRFTQEALAEEAGLSPQQINGIEGGRKFVSTESLLKIATALNIEVYQLFIPITNSRKSSHETNSGACFLCC